MSLAPILLACLAVLPQDLDPSGVSTALEAAAADYSVTEGGQDSARARLARLLARAATLPEGGATALLDSALGIGRAVVRRWEDSFPLQSVQRFARWPAARRLGKVRADSLRQAGNEAFAREGPMVALPLWRLSVAEAKAAGDSAGIAAGWGNMGSGFLAGAQPDSARVYLARSWRLATLIDDHRTAGNAVGALANAAKSTGRLHEAQSLYRQAARYRARSADTRGRAADLNNLGLIAEELGDLDSAVVLYRQALALNLEGEREAAAASNLVNLGNVAALRGQYRDAGTYYQEALAIRRRRGEKPEQATVLYDLGLLEVRRGDYLAAKRHLDESVLVHEDAALFDGAVAARIVLANLFVHLGQVENAVAQLRAAERLTVRDDVRPETRAELALVAGEVAVALNDLTEAEGSYEKAARLYERTGDLGGQAAAAEGRGLVLLHREEPAGAGAHLDRAILLRSRQGDLRALGVAHLLAGHARQGEAEFPRARAAYDSARTLFRQLGDPVGEAAVMDALGRLELAQGDANRAEEFFQAGMRLLAAVQVPALSWRLRSGLAEAWERRAQPLRAARILRRAVDEIELLRGSLPLDEWRSGYLADKWTVYGQLVSIEHRLGHPSAAFEASERMRARQMLDQLSLGRVRPAAVPDELAEEEQDLRRRLAELAHGAEVPGSETVWRRDVDVSANPVRDRGRDLAVTQASYERLLEKIHGASATYGDLVSGATVTPALARSRLRRGELLLSYVILDSSTIVFALSSDGTRSFRIPLSRSSLAALVDFTRGLIVAQGPPQRRELWRAPLRRLHRVLLGAVDSAGLLAGKQRLIIVPHAELHYVPFAALLQSAPREAFLVERFEIVYAPSVSLWVRLGDRVLSPRPTSILSVAPRPVDLPGSRAEVAAIRREFGDRATMLTDTQATEDAFRRAAARHEIVHLATYGVLNRRNPLFSYVQLGAGGSDDGRLEVHEAYGLRLNARLLVLSACETGLGAGAHGPVPPGDDWIGLVQAFLQAGAGNVLATLWPVDDHATSNLMGEFYAQLRGVGWEPTALAQAQRVALRRRESRSPFYWAGFTLTGGAR